MNHRPILWSRVARFGWPLLVAGTGCNLKASFGTQGSTPAGAVVQPQQIAPSAGGTPAVTGPAPTQPGVVEAGCSFRGSQLRGELGSTFQVSCPANCQDVGGLWGTDVYTSDSPICRAGIHAGLISTGGGVLGVRLDPGRPAYRGSVRNGIRSDDYGNFGGSYTVFRTSGSAPMAVAPVAAPPRGAQVIEAGCSFRASQIRGEVGTASVVSCPSGCADQGGTWGTDFYTSDSPICRAAIHSGLISHSGGTVVVILEPGRPAYRGTVRNGIRSDDYGSFGGSYRMQRP